MALFIFGAGATRGCSFVSPTEDPCLPPLDRDFFTQLQRVRNIKHQTLITAVMGDVVDIFGTNFSVTLETVYTTIEHTMRMLSVTGETRDYKLKDIKEKKARLEQAIALVLEESLTEKDDQGHSSVTPKSCSHHNAFVDKVLKAKDEIISFNYDCVLDYSLKNTGSKKWSPRYGYYLPLGSRGARLRGDEFWNPVTPAGEKATVHLYKLHGSLNFHVTGEGTSSKTALKQRPYTKQSGNLKFTIIPPEWHKAYDKGIFLNLWKGASQAIHKAKQIVVIGYSLPETDLHSTALFRTSLKKNGLSSLVVVNPDQQTRHRTRTIFQRGITKETKVISFDTFEHFVCASDTLWR